MHSHPDFRRAFMGLLPLLCLSLHTAVGGSATWNLDPLNGDWNTAATLDAQHDPKQQAGGRCI